MFAVSVYCEKLTLTSLLEPKRTPVRHVRLMDIVEVCSWVSKKEEVTSVIRICKCVKKDKQTKEAFDHLTSEFTNN